ncbi:hypothetical protein Cob_v000789 [Colletotrichum orbiculare MAFF 240422]|uniref:Uncharacterized protein n=1 Tax=Colletotrichum orbiculare (strain 104-T / ATCC 96160 / CBS 514.97 / LARS 414 / MAFF 240422) TaxID=1213857 RepID=A0A484G968_COLOR|nr:hypothetical protein Cob_v000789 [Colletotrichum orbiculare MAFF 240422]
MITILAEALPLFNVVLRISKGSENRETCRRLTCFSTRSTLHGLDGMHSSARKGGCALQQKTRPVSSDGTLEKPNIVVPTRPSGALNPASADQTPVRINRCAWFERHLAALTRL